MSLRTYRQSPAEAACAWNEIRRLDGWQTVWGEDELTHWHALLRKGCAADDVVAFALKFLRETRHMMCPSLGDFLMCFESYLEEDEAGRAYHHHRHHDGSHHAGL